MKKMFLPLLIMICPSLFAQNVVTTAGSSFSSTTGSISFTIGESIAQTMTSGDKVITMGFQQPNITVSIINEQKYLGYDISAYPNPVSDELKLKLSRDGLKNLEYFLTDMNGKTILHGKVNGTLTTIYFNQLPSGFYILKVIDNNREVKTFKVIKEK
jgi:hypothetical protein